MLIASHPTFQDRRSYLRSAKIEIAGLHSGSKKVWDRRSKRGPIFKTAVQDRRSFGTAVQMLCVRVTILICIFYFRCCKLTGETKSEAILTACLLLPPLHAASLTCLMRFLSQVAENSIHNKMDSRSLAIVFTPCLFPVSDSATNLKKVETTNADLATKLDIVETLIKNATKVKNLVK